MKKLFMIVALSAALMMNGVLTVSAQETEESVEQIHEEYDDIVLPAIECFEDAWKKNMKDYPSDGYLEIKNTRVFTVKEEPELSNAQKETFEEVFQGAKYVVDFLYYVDYFNNAPFYMYPGRINAVLVMEDGSVTIGKGNPIDYFRAKTFTTDMSVILEDVVDLGSAYNCVMDLNE